MINYETMSLNKNNKFLLTKQWIAKYLVKFDPSNFFSSKKIKYISFFYNIFISLFSFIIAITPIIISIVNENIMTLSQFGIFSLINLLLLVILFIDWFLFIFVCNTYYNTNNIKKIIVHILLNLPRMFQLLSTISMFILYGLFIQTSKEYVFVLKPNMDQNVFQIIIFVSLFLNVIVFFPRFLINVINVKKISILKTLFFKRMYAFIYSFIAVIIFTFVFAYIIFLTQVKNPTIDHNGNLVNWTYWKSLWFCFVTITTIGYGDIVVSTSLGKVFTIPLAVVGIICYGLISALFISMLNDYNQIKDELRRNAKIAREKHAEHDLLLKEINKIMLLNMHKANLIDKKTYLKLCNEDTIDEIISCDSIFEKIKIKNNNLCFNGKKMGNVYRRNIVPHMAVFSKPENAKKLMLMKNESINFVNKTLSSNKPIFFANLCEDENVTNIVLYTKKPHRLAYCEYKIAASFVMDKEEAWEKYGIFNDYSRAEFCDKFLTNEEIRVFIIEEKNIFEMPMLLESFGIYSNSKLKDIIYLL